MAVRPMSDSRTKIWFSLFVLAVFCLGAAAGVLVGRHIERLDRPDRTRDARLGPGPGASHGGPGGPSPPVLLERLTRELDLTSDQRVRVETILRASRDRVEQLQRDVRIRFDEEQRSLHDDIRQVLTPEQQERFERIVQDGRRGRGAGRGRGPQR